MYRNIVIRLIILHWKFVELSHDFVVPQVACSTWSFRIAWISFPPSPWWAPRRRFLLLMGGCTIRSHLILVIFVGINYCNYFVWQVRASCWYGKGWFWWWKMMLPWKCQMPGGPNDQLRGVGQRAAVCQHRWLVRRGAGEWLNLLADMACYITVFP